jgi:hypothetical protein
MVMLYCHKWSYIKSVQVYVMMSGKSEGYDNDGPYVYGNKDCVIRNYKDYENIMAVSISDLTACL